jgi:hypothetical protein
MTALNNAGSPAPKHGGVQATHRPEASRRAPLTATRVSLDEPTRRAMQRQLAFGSGPPPPKANGLPARCQL